MYTHTRPHLSKGPFPPEHNLQPKSFLRFLCYQTLQELWSHWQHTQSSMPRGTLWGSIYDIPPPNSQPLCSPAWAGVYNWGQRVWGPWWRKCRNPQASYTCQPVLSSPPGCESHFWIEEERRERERWAHTTKHAMKHTRGDTSTPLAVACSDLKSSIFLNPHFFPIQVKKFTHHSKTSQGKQKTSIPIIMVYTSLLGFSTYVDSVSFLESKRESLVAWGETLVPLAPPRGGEHDRLKCSHEQSQPRGRGEREGQWFYTSGSLSISAQYCKKLHYSSVYLLGLDVTEIGDFVLYWLGDRVLTPTDDLYKSTIHNTSYIIVQYPQKGIIVCS